MIRPVGGALKPLGDVLQAEAGIRESDGCSSALSRTGRQYARRKQLVTERPVVPPGRPEPAESPCAETDDLFRCQQAPPLSRPAVQENKHDTTQNGRNAVMHIPLSFIQPVLFTFYDR